MTISVTTTDSLILAPIGWPRTRAEVLEVEDAFNRVVGGLREGVLRRTSDRQLVAAHQSAPDFPFRLIPILRDGWTFAPFVPSAWGGCISRDVVADYWRSDTLLWPRPPSWGVHLDIEPGADDATFRLILPAKRPLIDPLRDTVADDDPTTISRAIEVEGDWADFLTPWEQTEAFAAGINPGALWKARRTIPFRPMTDRWWWELRGLRDSGDPARYGSDQWTDDHTITAFLGWHAFAVTVAEETVPCSMCNRWVIRGRRYCGAEDCNRARAVVRQRDRRTRGQIPKRRAG